MENCESKLVSLVMLPYEHAVDDNQKIIRIVKKEDIENTIHTSSRGSSGVHCSFPLNFLSYYENLEDWKKRD